ncbi:hypothetical protein PC116_g30569 [Phytophthora cactorum]|uniref:Retrotransposon gag domain-containing protein n=1 Tax=Phytophthora cactorum TaxID=29920 RepID=A0A8T0XYY5_9STRA|nr:hypothetical protein Pcac1_g14352 [Phytophthora cactorum]KAG2774973.1 hypothetical protein Pcac1_g14351 [Phytophthora cactorum]KAG2802189.1 hypothetical protein PC113_g24517 [Phytophthora cactorum]KAG2954923.1 hypothetical protein PC118_g24804 [Phytophthora cactorum]KAG4220952.1 hypothetical protein PC116_g30569 [Phytophthora cactorum]
MWEKRGNLFSDGLSRSTLPLQLDASSKVAFAISCLGGRARGWAYGRRLTDATCFGTDATCFGTDATCFGTYAEFKEEIRQAFKPPKNEFRSRAEFLDLQQGKHDVHAYVQRARCLVSSIVTNPIDEATKVVTFMKGFKDGLSRSISSESTRVLSRLRSPLPRKRKLTCGRLNYMWTCRGWCVR